MRRKVLVVEDDRAIRRGLVDALRFAGYETVDAADGEEGLAQALVPGIDLVLLDVLMPKRDGFSVLEELRRARPALPVIVLTAKGTEEDRVRGLKGGADDYVVKPFSANELLARVDAVLRRSPERPRSIGSFAIRGCTIDFERRELRFEDGAPRRPDRARGRDPPLPRREPRPRDRARRAARARLGHRAARPPHAHGRHARGAPPRAAARRSRRPEDHPDGAGARVHARARDRGHDRRGRAEPGRSFGACLALVGLALFWVTREVLDLERREAAARDDAHVQEADAARALADGLGARAGPGPGGGASASGASRPVAGWSGARPTRRPTAFRRVRSRSTRRASVEPRGRAVRRPPEAGPAAAGSGRGGHARVGARGGRASSDSGRSRRRRRRRRGAGGQARREVEAVLAAGGRRQEGGRRKRVDDAERKESAKDSGTLDALEGLDKNETGARRTAGVAASRQNGRRAGAQGPASSMSSSARGRSREQKEEATRRRRRRRRRRPARIRSRSGRRSRRRSSSRRTSTSRGRRWRNRSSRTPSRTSRVGMVTKRPGDRETLGWLGLAVTEPGPLEPRWLTGQTGKPELFLVRDDQEQGHAASRPSRVSGATGRSSRRGSSTNTRDLFVGRPARAGPERRRPGALARDDPGAVRAGATT